MFLIVTDVKNRFWQNVLSNTVMVLPKELLKNQCFAYIHEPYVG